MLEPLKGFTIGRVVHYVMPDGAHRPALIVNDWHDISAPCEGYANLQVFTDGPNDGDEYKSGLYWATSICHSEDPRPGTWHFPEYVP